MSRLNAICPYFATFPIEYPLGIINVYRPSRILDPFCGRGTVNLAARVSDLFSIGLDSSPVAAAITYSKFAVTTPEEIVKECEYILSECEAFDIPSGGFWERMYRPEVLRDLCKLRGFFLDDGFSDAQLALRGLLLGALHGPLRADGSSSYLSNQFPRSIAFKPGYSLKYWDLKGTVAPKVDVLDIVRLRAGWYFSEGLPRSKGFCEEFDSRSTAYFEMLRDTLESPYMGGLLDCVITSPPYCGLNTYLQDQWVRNWFLGGPSEVDYRKCDQFSNCPEAFVRDLRQVFDNCSIVCRPGSEAFVRFGGIGSSRADPVELIYNSLGHTWDILDIDSAGEPGKGRRIGETFTNSELPEYNEIDVHAVFRG